MKSRAVTGTKWSHSAGWIISYEIPPGRVAVKCLSKSVEAENESPGRVNFLYNNSTWPDATFWRFIFEIQIWKEEKMEKKSRFFTILEQHRDTHSHRK